MQNIKAIIFDFGGVILNIDYYKTNKAFRDMGVKGFDDMYSQKNADPLFHHLEEGKLNEKEFYDAFRKSTHLTLTDHQIKKAWNAMLLSFRKEAFNKIYKDEIGEGSLHDYFDKIYYSHEMGYRKPGNEAYEYVLKENNLSPSETLFIDDSIQNINTAKVLGLQTIFLKDGMKLEDLNL